MKPGQSEIRLNSQVLKVWQKTVLDFTPPRMKKNNAGKSEDSRIYYLIQQNISAITNLWESYTSERGNLGKYQSTTLAGAYAYLLGFHLPNAARTELILGRLTKERGISFKPFLGNGVHVFDLGVGTGAMSSAVIAHLVEAEKFLAKDIKVEMMDRSGSFLDIARPLIAKQIPDANIRSLKMPLEKFDLGRSLNDSASSEGLKIVLMGYVWNEIARNRGAAGLFMKGLNELSQSKNPGVVIFSDSSNERQAFESMAFRDTLSEMQMAPIYPCPNANPCPMLEAGRDWCYSEGLWNQPVAMERLDKALHVNRSRFATAGYVFANKAAMKMFGKTEFPAVVVGRPKEQGVRTLNFEYLLCEGRSVRKQPGDRRELLRGTVYEKASTK